MLPNSFLVITKEVVKMRYFTRLRRVLVIFVLFYLLFPRAAYAYIDPGTGSFLLQMLIAALVGTALSVKVFWNKVKNLFKKLFCRNK